MPVPKAARATRVDLLDGFKKIHNFPIAHLPARNRLIL